MKFISKENYLKAKHNIAIVAFSKICPLKQNQ